jgi:acyl-ACP thioesterase
MLSFFQDNSSLHAANLGASVEWLYSEHRSAWVLMRFRLEIDRYPKLSQDISVESWPQDPKGFYERDFIIRGQGGETLVRAASTWVIVNLDTRKIKRERFLDFHNVEICRDRAIGGGVGSLKPMADAETLGEKTMCYSDIDYNNHVNNARYLDHIMDCFPMDMHRDHAVRAVEMHYINEAHPGDVIVFRRKCLAADSGKRIYVDGMLKTDGAAIFTAAIEFE